MTITQKFISDNKKLYKNLASIEIDGNKLVIRNKFTGALHPFTNGKEVIQISNEQKIQIHQWL